VRSQGTRGRHHSASLPTSTHAVLRPKSPAERTLEIDPAFSYFTDPLVYVYESFGRWRD